MASLQAVKARKELGMSYLLPVGSSSPPILQNLENTPVNSSVYFSKTTKKIIRIASTFIIFAGICALFYSCLSPQKNLFEQWECKCDGPVYDVVTNSSQNILFGGTKAGTLYQINYQTGEIMHQWQIGSKIRGIAIDPKKNRLFCGTEAGKIYCINYLTKEYVSEYENVNKDDKKTYCVRNVTYDDENDLLFFTSYDGCIHCIGCDNGTLTFHWKQETDKNTGNDKNPTYKGNWVRGLDLDSKENIVFYGSKNTQLYGVKYTQDSNSLLWQKPTGNDKDNYVRSVVCDDKKQRIFSISNQGPIRCFSYTGTLLWQSEPLEVDGDINVESITYDPKHELLFCTSEDKDSVYCFCAKTREKKWIERDIGFKTHTGIIVDPDNKHIFLPTGNGVKSMRYHP